ncbi:uncharacterized protein LOC111114717 isoform X1 [Crassostrea virginica]
MNSYSNLTFNTMDYSYSNNGIQGSTSYQIPSGASRCDFKCLCCVKLQMGQETSCNVSKTSIGTQTSIEPPQGLDPEAFWTRGTYEHSLLQKTINTTIEKFSLKGKKDVNWEAATSDIMTTFAQDMAQTPANRKRVHQRLKKATYWGKILCQKRVSIIFYPTFSHLKSMCNYNIYIN